MAIGTTDAVIAAVLSTSQGSVAGQHLAVLLEHYLTALTEIGSSVRADHTP